MTRSIRTLLFACTCGVAVATLTGCYAFGLAELERREGTHPVETEYEGLQGKSVAVVVNADRKIQSEFPTVVEQITARVNERLSKNGAARSHSDTTELLSFLYNRPQWTTKPLGELAKELKVERIVYIELREFRLHEPGNSWTWDGAVSGVVAVIEADSDAPDEYAFQRPISVSFPDSPGLGPAQFNGQDVASVLLKRFVDRAAWPFYKHDEDNEPKY